MKGIIMIKYLILTALISVPTLSHAAKTHYQSMFASAPGNPKNSSVEIYNDKDKYKKIATLSPNKTKYVDPGTYIIKGSIGKVSCGNTEKEVDWNQGAFMIDLKSETKNKKVISCTIGIR